MTDKITLDELVSVFFTSKSFLVKHFKQETCLKSPRLFLNKLI